MSKGFAVHMFFMASGYSICVSLDRRRKDQSALTFLTQKFKRIYMPYWWSLLLIGLIGPFASGIVKFAQGQPFTPQWIPYSITDWTEVATLTRVFFADSWRLGDIFKPIWINWYLAIIVQIYFVVFLILAFRCNFMRVSIALAVMSLLVMNSTFLNLVPMGLFLPFWIEIFIGMLLYSLIHKIGYSWSSSRMHIVVITFLAASLFAVLCYYSGKRIFFGGLVACILYLVYPYDKNVASNLAARLMSSIGRLSYSIYLTHNPVVWVMIPVLHMLHAPVYLLPVITVVLSIITGYCWYVFFEKPSTPSLTTKAIMQPLRSLRSNLNL